VPEGDTIFRSADTLHRALAGQCVTRFESVLVRLARVDEDRPIAGRIVEQVASRGKHLLMHFSGDLILRSHMRMHGSWHLYRPGERWQCPRIDMRIVVGTAAFDAVAFRVPVAEFHTAVSLARDRVMRELGPDLLAADFPLDEGVSRLRALGARPVAEALLDQRAVAGIGNVFKSEVLFESRVSPWLPVSALEDGALRHLLETARRQLRMNGPLSAAAVSPSNGGRRTTRRMNPAERLFVYGRAGKPCRVCGGIIAATKEGEDARVTYYCARCQGTAG
jgi:endonuclease VIII